MAAAAATSGMWRRARHPAKITTPSSPKDPHIQVPGVPSSGVSVHARRASVATPIPTHKPPPRARAAQPRHAKHDARKARTAGACGDACGKERSRCCVLGIMAVTVDSFKIPRRTRRPEGSKARRKSKHEQPSRQERQGRQGLPG